MRFFSLVRRTHYVLRAASATLRHRFSSPISGPLTASSATIVCDRLCVSTPITIICTVPSLVMAFGVDLRRTHLNWGDATLLSSHAGDPRRRRATRQKPVRPRSTGEKRVSPPPSESQTDEPDRPDRRAPRFSLRRIGGDSWIGWRDVLSCWHGQRSAPHPPSDPGKRDGLFVGGCVGRQRAGRQARERSVVA
jgi:hypothetical protein